MARTSLAERMTRLDQQKARIAEQEAKLKTDERKQRTRRLIEAGALIEKAGLLDLDANALYGALLSLNARMKDAALVAQWAKAGGQVFDREAKARDALKEPLVVTFAKALPTPFTTQLRAAGLRWNKVLQHWEGLADPDTVAELCGEHDGALRRLRPPDSSTKEPERAHRQGSEKSAGAT
jgi:hypothetical protein